MPCGTLGKIKHPERLPPPAFQETGRSRASAPRPGLTGNPVTRTLSGGSPFSTMISRVQGSVTAHRGDSEHSQDLLMTKESVTTVKYGTAFPVRDARESSM